MCGIVGITFENRSKESAAKRLLAMRDTMIYRGPDDSGIFIDDSIGLGHRRLAILDLSARGRQPMASADGRYWISYNGEIYNYLELCELLKSKGYRFQSNTDTEVLLYGYIEFGIEVLPKLNGMFAFSIWDSKEKKLLVARDRLGIKPLYYAIQKNQLFFASEEKALFAGGVSSETDREAFLELLYFRYVAGEKTPYKNVKRLLPGHYLIWEQGRPISIHRWWSLYERVRELREQTVVKVDSWFRETFDHAVQARRVSDVPVGVLLSGGMDSGNIAASLGSQGHSDVTCFTVQFKESGFDESHLAKEVAEKWNMPFSALCISPRDLYSLSKEVVHFLDGPMVHQNDAHLLAIARYAKSQVSVLLSGEGGDETLCGYVRYQPLLYPGLLSLIRIISGLLNPSIISHQRLLKLKRFSRLKNLSEWVLYNTLSFFPEDLEQSSKIFFDHFHYRKQILKEASALYPGELVRQAMYYDQHTHLCSLLDRNDRMTMGASIECRVPFLDYRLVENLAALPTSQLIGWIGKKKFLRKYLKARLPYSVKKARKWGFGVPWAKYFRENKEWHPLLFSLSKKAMEQDMFLSSLFLERCVREFMKGESRHDIFIEQLMMISLWHKHKPEAASFLN